MQQSAILADARIKLIGLNSDRSQDVKLDSHIDLFIVCLPLPASGLSSIILQGIGVAIPRVVLH